MSSLLVSFIKKKYDENKQREQFGVLSGFVGILLNVLLGVVKFIAGRLSGSVSITADAVNNLSDAASNIVTIAGTKLANKPVDEEHPFGHGRMEYVSALAVSGLIFLMGYELAGSSISKILHPEGVNFSYYYVAILTVSILVKLWMAYFNNKLFKITDNINLKAVRQDSLNDCISTFATLVAMVLSHLFDLKWLDGVVGLAVAVLIFFAGIGIIKDILGPLLGQPPSKELVESIEKIMLDEELIVGVHDLIVHDYGPGRIIASAHAEVPEDHDITEIHDVIDNVEKKIMDSLNIIICIHMDPIDMNDEEVAGYREMASEIIGAYNSGFSFHDFRMVKGATHTNLIFDLIVPHCDATEKSKINSDLKALFREKDSKLNLVIQIEHSFI